jgi:alpha-glucoside transport system substrate-binding protein
MMLRTQPPDVYDQWVSNEIPFTDERVVAPSRNSAGFARNDDYVVAGGAGAVASTDFRDSPKGLFDLPPQCYMHRQASFIPAFFPEGTEVGEDADFFYFPAYAEKDLGKPVLGAGTLWAITNDSPGAQALIEVPATPIAHEVWMAQKGLPDAATRGQHRCLSSTTSDAREDERHPAWRHHLPLRRVGPDARRRRRRQFWTGMVDYAGGKPPRSASPRSRRAWDTLK